MNLQIKEFYFQDQFYGLSFETTEVLVFFGNKDFEKKYREIFPKYNFSILKQNHGDTLLNAIEPFNGEVPADAQWTEEKNLALIIQTADCIPAFLWDAEAKKICAIHAGWKGVHNRIIPKSISSLWINQKINILLGPHIQKNSFEIDEDVKKLLEHTTPLTEDCFSIDFPRKKFFASLKKIAKNQIQQVINEFSFFSSDIDTKTDERFCSFRRSGKDAGRNFSFIVKK